MKDEFNINDDFNPLKKEVKNSDFKVPESYFENFKKELDLKIKTGFQDDFKVPEGYFEESKASPLNVENEKNVISISRRKRNIIWYSISGVAATIAIILTLNFTESSECESFACLLERTTITQEDIEYLEEYDENSLFEVEEF